MNYIKNLKLNLKFNKNLKMSNLIQASLNKIIKNFHETLKFKQKRFL